MLEAVVRDRGLLRALSVEERTRLLSAAGDVYNPDLVAAAAVGQGGPPPGEGGEAAAGRDACSPRPASACCASKPVFTTPNVFPPAGFEQSRRRGDPESARLIEPQHCYVCKQHYLEIHPFYDQLCPACGDFNFASGRRRPTCGDASRCSPAGG